jgi:hypothetical protein
MKPLDLESKLKSLRVPDPGEEFWEGLPRRVLARARTDPAPDAGVWPARRSLPAVLKLRIALAVVAAAFCLWQSRLPQTVSRLLWQNGRQTRLAIAQLPERLDTLMRDEHGLHDLVQDPP